MGIIKRFIFIVFLLSAVTTLSAQLPAEKEYRIGLLLPFKSGGPKTPVSEAMLDYYEGFTMAAASLEQEGLKARIYVFDTEKDSSALETLLEHPDLPKMNMIVGPVYEKGLKPLEDFCAARKITLISPLKYYYPSSTGTIINFFTPDTVRMIQVLRKAHSAFPKHRIYIVQDANAASKNNAAMLLRTAKSLKINNVKLVTLTGTTLSPVINRTDSIVLISAIGALSAKNPLNNFLKAKKKSWLFAAIEWHGALKNSSSLDEPKIIYPEMTLLRPGDTTTRVFADEYYDQYYSDPSIYAYIGYDQANYLLYGLMAFGDSFWRNTIGLDYAGMINHVKLEQQGNQLNNTGLYFIRILEGKKEEFAP